MRKALVWMPLFLACTAFISFGPVPGRLLKAFEALRVYNYFAAKEGFDKSFEKHPVPAAYGLSLIYARTDNPFSNLDSACHLIYHSESEYGILVPKIKAAYEVKLGLDSATIVHQREQVDSLMLIRALHDGSVVALETYMSHRRTERFYSIARTERDVGAFELARRSDSAQGYLNFAVQYPDAPQTANALELYELRLFQENTASGEVAAYQSFLNQYPESPHREEAEYEIYHRSTLGGRVVDYKAFINTNPKNPYTEDAWRMIYALELGDNSPRSIATFTLNYPDYPFKDEIKRDFDLATTPFYPISEGEFWGFIDQEGNVRIAPQYEWTEPFSEGLALVGMHGEAAYVDKRGKPITRKRFEDGLPFNNGYAMVQFNDKQGIINRLGQWVIKPEYDACGEFSEGLCYVGVNGLFGYANTKGQVVIPLAYDFASDFNHGLAVVGKGGLFGYIDTLGVPRTDLKYEWLESMQPHGVARYRLDQSFGLIHQGRDSVADVAFDAIADYSEGYYLVARDGKYGYITAQGEERIPLQFHYGPKALSTSGFSGGYARVYQMVKREVKLGIIDTLGQKVMPAMFEGIGQYSKTLTAVRKKDLWGYADAKMNLAIKYQYDAAGDFADSMAVVTIKGKTGLIDVYANWVIPPLYNDIQQLDIMYFASSDTLHTIFNHRGDSLAVFIGGSFEKVDEAVIKITEGKLLRAYFNCRKLRIIWREP